jgi:CubicO group peptidase (beta-lactamase class C family)
MRIPLLALSLLFVAQSAGAVFEGRVAAIEEYLHRLERLGFSGSVLVARRDQVLLAEGYGLADRESRRPWTPRTISTVGSITKPFTGAAILALSEDGRLTVGDPITKYFENVPADKRSITLHHLLTHSSGIVDLAGPGDFDPIGREEFVRRALEQELAFGPGEGYEYSNAGYSLLGAVIEQLTGGSYEAFVRERFFLPAGMKDTGYILAAFDSARLAQGYRGGEKWGTVLERPMAEDGPYWVLRANGGIHSTVEDMHRWALHLLAGKALSPQSTEAYWSPHVDEGGGDSFYGYGWVVMDHEGMRVITHNGGNGILFADMAIVPESGVVMVLQCNVLADFGVVNTLLQHVGTHLLQGTPLPSVPDVVDRPRSELEPYAGTYVLPADGMLDVRAGDGTLDISALDADAFTALFSTRPPDPARAHKLNARIDAIIKPWLKGDVEALWTAYGGRAPHERLRASYEEAMAEWTSRHGALVGHRVLGTAFRQNDVTLVRVEFERGHVERLYVWDTEEEKLLGMSQRGLDPVLHAFPEADGSFASWEARTGTSRPMRFEKAADGTMQLVFEDADGMLARRKPARTHGR